MMNKQKQHFFPVLVFLLAGTVLSLQAQIQSTPEHQGLAVITREQAEAVIGFLASDELEGREAGTRGGKVAGQYLAGCLRQIGIQPLFEEGYFQPFEAYSYERQQRTRFQVHPDSVAMIKKGVHRKLSLRNVLGVIPGKKQMNV